MLKRDCDTDHGLGPCLSFNEPSPQGRRRSAVLGIRIPRSDEISRLGDVLSEDEDALCHASSTSMCPICCSAVPVGQTEN